ncbi:MAG: tetratricopeptide repeat protein [Isosphaeraceae bacterium]
MLRPFLSSFVLITVVCPGLAADDPPAATATPPAPAATAAETFSKLYLKSGSMLKVDATSPSGADLLGEFDPAGQYRRALRRYEVREVKDDQIHVQLVEPPGPISGWVRLADVVPSFDANRDLSAFNQQLSAALAASPPTDGMRISALQNDLGILTRNLGDAGLAQGYFEKAIHADPTNATAYKNRADCLVDQRKLRQALADYSDALRLDPGYAEVLIVRGDVLRTLGDLDTALVDLQQAARLVDLDPRPALYQSEILTTMNRGALARDQANEAIRQALLVPQPFSGHPLLGDAYRARGDAHAHLYEFDQALRDYETAIAKNGIDGSARLHRARLLLLTNKRDEAIKLLGEAAAAQPEAKRWLDVLNASAGATAESELIASLIDRPNEPRALVALCAYYSKLNSDRRVDALITIADARHTSPNYVPARQPFQSLVDALSREKAVGDELRKRAADGLNLGALRALAWWQFTNGQWAEAERTFDAIHTRDESDVFALVGKARSQWRGSNADAAEGTLRDAIAQAPRLASPHVWLARLLFEKPNASPKIKKEAFDQVNTAIQLDPTQALPYALRARITLDHPSYSIHELGAMVADAEAALRNANGPSAYLLETRARAYAANSVFDRALADVTLALASLSPTDTNRATLEGFRAELEKKVMPPAK